MKSKRNFLAIVKLWSVMLLSVIVSTIMFSCTLSKNKASYFPKKYEHLISDETFSNDYEVWINDVKAIVYVARVQDDPWQKERTNLDFGGNYSFTTFDMNKPVKVKIKSENKTLDYTKFLPEGINIKDIKKDSNELSFTIERPTKLIVEPDGKNGPLLLFANPVDEFNANLEDPNLIYYGPGIHYPDSALITLKENQTLYLAEGAIVKAGVDVEGDNVTICGRGIICGNDFVWGKFSRHLIHVKNSKNVVVKDIILRGGATWTMPIRNSKNIIVDNVKIVGGRAQNDDGINPVNSQDVLITDCFIRTDDDCIALKGMKQTPFNENIERITVENSILWCDRARIFLLGHESRAEYMRDLEFKNIDIVHFSMTPFLLEPGENMKLENAVFEDIRINGEGQDELIRLKPVVNQYMYTKVPGYISDITFKNLSVTGSEGLYKIQLEGADEEHKVNNIEFFNVNITDEKVGNDYSNLEIGDNVFNVSFK